MMMRRRASRRELHTCIRVRGPLRRPDIAKSVQRVVHCWMLSALLKISPRVGPCTTVTQFTRQKKILKGSINYSIRQSVVCRDSRCKAVGLLGASHNSIGSRFTFILQASQWRPRQARPALKVSPWLSIGRKVSRDLTPNRCRLNASTQDSIYTRYTCSCWQSSFITP
jgi:hypothetical protein